MEWLAMERRYTRGFNAVAKEELWERWQHGGSLKAIGRAFGKPSSSIYFQVAPHGGIRSARRRRSRLALTLTEREEISRELANNPRLRQLVASKLELNWSPEQIAGWLKRLYPEDERYRVSHETIYCSLYIQARGVLKKELVRHLRSKRSMRRPRRAGDKRGQIADLVSISKRPATVEDRAVPGHWEGDLLSGSNNSYIATLVERHTRYVTLAKVANKDTQTVVSALVKQAKTIPNELYRSLT